jgi:acetylornithine deacetylase/succinyl-diaminopimelate desuccinylase-like protein
VRTLAELVRLPSVSAQPAHRADVAACAAWLVRHLGRIGLTRPRLAPTPTGGPPVVMADSPSTAGAPTVLLYGHYDVQPADARDGWSDPPFAAVIRGDELRGRGASDDKGQLFAHLAALESWLATEGPLPVNLRCVFEGEEEIGSPGLLALMRAQPASFAADAAIISDMPMVGPDRPALTYAVRGLVAAEVTISRAGGELHSGLYGGAVEDPVLVACRMAASLRGPDGRVTLPSFYAPVRAIGDAERAAIAQVARLGGGPAAVGEDVDAGEPAFTPLERTTIRPALTVAGIAGGGIGAEGKSAIARAATVRFDLRLVPDQRPAAVMAALERHCAAFATPSLSVRFAPGASAAPLVLERDGPALRAAARAYARAFGRAPLWRRSSGSVPVAAALHERGVTPVLAGFALPDDRIHGPNERLHLPTFFRAIETSLALWEELGSLRSAPRPRAARVPLVEARP